jgi:hypothetical protein
MTLSRTSKSAKKRVAEQKRNKAGKFTSNKRYKDDNDDDFIPELSDSDNFYSENSDSDSDECANQRINCLPEFKLVWTDIAVLEQKKRHHILATQVQRIIESMDLKEVLLSQQREQVLLLIFLNQ